MKTSEILILGLFIIAVCVVSLIPFSNSSFEGFKEGANSWGIKMPNTQINIGTTTPRITTPSATTPRITTPRITTPGSTTPSATTPGSTTPGLTTPGLTTPGSTTPGLTTPGSTTPGSTTPGTTTPAATLIVQKFPTSITTNVEFINAIIYVIAQPSNQSNDKVSVYNIQGLVSPFNTQNSATLLGEMANPKNLTDSRLFLQYMNWFASHCPLDSNTCTGLC